MGKSQSDRELFHKIKLVIGDGFLTIEDTNKLNHHELMAFLVDFLRQDIVKKSRVVNILIDHTCKKEVLLLLEENGFVCKDERVTVYKRLDIPYKGESPFLMKGLKEIGRDVFKDIWREVMQGSLNAPSSLSMDEQMHSVETELGGDYAKSCLVAYESDQPIGVIMPHIEPGTLNE